MKNVGGDAGWPGTMTPIGFPSRIGETPRAGKTGGKALLPPIETGWKRPVGDPALDAVVTRLAGLDGQALRGYVEKGEAGAPIDRARLIKSLAKVKEGQTIAVPLDAIRPGQVQISFLRAREKVPEILSAVGAVSGAKKAGSLALVTTTRLPVVLGPGGQIILLDGHHKLTALKTLLGLAGDLGPDLVPKRADGPLAWLKNATRQIEVVVERDLRRLDPAEFWRVLGSGELGPNYELFLEARSGKKLPQTPERFGGLEDNPYREAAGSSACKLKLDGDRLIIGGAARPLWVKGLAARNFVEFAVARVYEDVFKARGRVYDPSQPIDDEARGWLYEGLVAAKANRRHRWHRTLSELELIKPDAAAAEVEARIRGQWLRERTPTGPLAGP